MHLSDGESNIEPGEGLAIRLAKGISWCFRDRQATSYKSFTGTGAFLMVVDWPVIQYYKECQLIIC